MVKRDGHTLEEVMTELARRKKVGCFGSIEIFFQKHDIFKIESHETFRPGELPGQPDLPVSCAAIT